MSEETKVPAWLETMANKIAVDENWPSGQYPQAAFDALDIVGETAVDGDSAVSLLQVVIGEVERLNSIDTRFAGVLRYAEEHCGHSPLAGKPGEVTLMEDHQRLRAIADAVGELPLGDGVSACVPQPVINAIAAAWTAWKEAAEAAAKEAGT